MIMIDFERANNSKNVYETEIGIGTFIDGVKVRMQYKAKGE